MKEKKKVSILLFLISSMLLLVPISFVPFVNASPDWLSGWSYRKYHTVDGTTAGEQTNYVMEHSLTTAIFPFSRFPTNAAQNETIPNPPSPLGTEKLHPGVVYFASGWNGYNYWMAFTPSGGENPCIVVNNQSHGTWVVPSGGSNPIETDYATVWSDTDLFYDSASDQLWCYYRSATGTEYVYRKTSSDGVSWSSRSSLGLTGDGDSLMSPSIEKVGATYYLWTVDAVVGGENIIYRRTSANGISGWSAPTAVTLSEDYSEGGTATEPWHLDMFYNTAFSEYWMTLMVCQQTQAGSGLRRLLFGHGNGTYFNMHPVPMLSYGSSGNWDDNAVYRSTMLWINNKAYLWYTGDDGGPNNYQIGFTESDVPVANFRVTKSDGTTELQYRMVNWHSGTQTGTIYVKHDVIPASPNSATIYYYYVDPDALTTHNASLTLSSPPSPPPTHAEWGPEEASTIDNSEYNYVDDNTSDVDDSDDIGSHSNFENQKSSNGFDTLTEYGTLGGYEDFTTYTEVDAGGDITKNATRITVDTIQRAANSYVYKDMGTGHFSGNFEHEVDFRITADFTAADREFGLWKVGLSYGAGTGWSGDLTNWLQVFVWHASSYANTQFKLIIRERYNSANYANNGGFLATQTNYYLTISRSTSTFSCKVYSDSARTTLLETISLTLQSIQSYRYIHGFINAYYTGTQVTSGYIENLDLQEFSLYQLDLEVAWSGANYTRSNEQLCIKTGTLAAEDIRVDVWNGSTWINLFTDLTANSWNNISIGTYLTSQILVMRFKGGSETSDTTQDTWEIDATLLHVWTLQYERSANQPLSTSAIPSRLTNIQRTANQILQAITQTSKIIVITRALTQQVNINLDVGRVFIGVRETFEKLLIELSVDRIFTALRSPLQSVSVESVVSRIQNSVRDVTQTLRGETTITRTLFVNRTVNQFLSNLVSVSRESILTRSISQSLTQQISVSRIMYGFRNVIQPVNVVSSTLRVGGFVRSVTEVITGQSLVSTLITRIRATTQPLSINSLVTRNYLPLRNIMESLKTTVNIERTLSSVRTALQNIMTTTQAIRNLFGERSLTQDMTISTTATRLLQATRQTQQQFIINTQILTEKIGIYTREITQAINTQAIASRIFYGNRNINQISQAISSMISQSFILRNIQQPISLQTSTIRLATILRQVSQPTSITAQTERVAYAFRNIQAILQSTIQIERTSIALRDITQKLDVSTQTARLLTSLRTIEQSAMQVSSVTRLTTLTRQVSQTVLNEVTATRLVIALRTMEQSFMVKMEAASLPTKVRAVTQQLNMVISLTRTFYATRTIQQPLSIPAQALGEKIGYYTRQVTITLQTQALVERVAYMSRGINQLSKAIGEATKQFTAIRTFTQLSSITMQTSRLAIVSRTLSQLLTSNTATSRIYYATRTIQQHVITQVSIIRTSFIVRQITQSLTSSIQVQRLLSATRNIQAAIRTYVDATRTLYAQRTIPQPLEVFADSIKTGIFQRLVNQPSFAFVDMARTAILTRQNTASIISQIQATRNLGAIRGIEQPLKIFSQGIGEKLGYITREVTQTITIISEATRTQTLQRILNQPLQAFISVVSTKINIRTVTSTFQINSFVEGLRTVERAINQQLKVTTALSRWISITINIQQTLRAITTVSSTHTPFGIGRPAWIHIPNILTATLQPIESPQPKLTEVWNKKVPITAKVTVKNHLGDSRTVTITWWVTKLASDKVLVNGTRILELDQMNPEVTAIINFDLPVDEDLIPKLTDIYTFYTEIEYSFGEKTFQTQQLTTHFMLQDTLIQQHLIYLILIIISLSVITVIVYFLRKNNQPQSED